MNTLFRVVKPVSKGIEGSVGYLNAKEMPKEACPSKWMDMIISKHGEAFIRQKKRKGYVEREKMGWGGQNERHEGRWPRDALRGKNSEIGAESEFPGNPRFF